jgi:hypothetical protein
MNKPSFDLNITIAMMEDANSIRFDVYDAQNLTQQ